MRLSRDKRFALQNVKVFDKIIVLSFHFSPEDDEADVELCAEMNFVCGLELKNGVLQDLWEFKTDLQGSYFVRSHFSWPLLHLLPKPLGVYLPCIDSEMRSSEM